MVTIEDFLKVEMRVGVVTEVGELQTRKPMYRLTVDLGELGTRQIAAGIKDFYSSEELLGKRIIVIVNLDPKRIGDFVSEGMLLAADDGTQVSLIVPERELPPGSRIR